jgi:AcrR family transcriptional regulator
MVARRAGVSTKTLYRLIPNKAALFEGMVSDHLDRLLSQVNLKDYVAALMAFAALALDKEVIVLPRMGSAGGGAVLAGLPPIAAID